MVDTTFDPSLIAGATSEMERFSSTAKAAASSVYTMQDAVNELKASSADVANTRLIDPTALGTLDSLVSSTGILAGNLAKGSAAAQQFKEESTKIYGSQQAAVKALEKQARQYKRLAVMAGGQGKQGAALTKTFRNLGNTTKAVASHMTGMNFSLTGIIMMMIAVHNEARKIGGLARQAAGRLGGYPAQVAQTRKAIHDLRGAFALSYDEAGKVTEALTSMGFVSSQIADKNKKEFAASFAAIANKARKPLQMAAREVGTEFTREAVQNPLAAVRKFSSTRESLTKKVAQSEKKISVARLAHMSKAVGLATELYAIQVKYGVSTKTSGTVVKGLMQDYQVTENASRGMLGTVIKTAERLRTAETPVSIEEVVQDWGMMIEKVKIYKTDLHGVLALYNTLISKKIADKIGLGGVALSVRKDIAKTLSGMPLELSLGWKAKLGEAVGPGLKSLGATTAERSIKFEDLWRKEGGAGMVEGLQRVAAVTEKMSASGDKYTAQIKARRVLGQMGFGKEAQVELSRAMANGEFNSEKVQALAKAQIKELAAIKAANKKWEKGRGALVSDAAKTAKALQKIEEIIKKWAVDKLMPAVEAIVGFLTKIFEGISKLVSHFTGETISEGLEKTFVSNAPSGKRHSVQESINKFIENQISRDITHAQHFSASPFGQFDMSDMDKSAEPKFGRVKRKAEEFFSAGVSEQQLTRLLKILESKEEHSANKAIKYMNDVLEARHKKDKAVKPGKAQVQVPRTAPAT